MIYSRGERIFQREFLPSCEVGQTANSNCESGLIVSLNLLTQQLRGSRRVQALRTPAPPCMIRCRQSQTVVQGDTGSCTIAEVASFGRVVEESQALQQHWRS